ncbi:DegT/DnrJ/EryC1/StrS family aminotransferase [Patescibacteria group bacterium]|nr:DegT/DnrJ/EryC1/StrS family aminotransferase [Patescibacteria group bacterium]
MSEKLAIQGGRPVVDIDSSEQWKRPIEKEMDFIRKLLKEGYLSGAGAGLPKEFEEKFREFIDARYCLTTDHGTTALMSAYYAVGVGPGDEVITPVGGFICSYAGAIHLGARPVFADVDPKTLLIDPKDVERKITRRTRAINIVHLGGNICDMDAFLGIGRKYGIAIVEDAAHAHGAEWNGNKIGSIGDITCFSLQGVNPTGKPVAGGEGGIVTTNNREFYERQLIYCHLHRAGIKSELTNPSYHILDEQVLGLKFRAYPLALAIAKVSLDTLEYRIKRSDENRKRIFDALKKLPGLEPEHSYPKAKRVSLYGGLKIIYNSEELNGLPIQKFVEAVRAEGSPISDPGWKHAGSTQKLQHLKPLFVRGFDVWGHNRGSLGNDFKVAKKGAFPVAESLDRKFFTIPSYINPKEGFFHQYIAAFEKVIANYKSLL